MKHVALIAAGATVLVLVVFFSVLNPIWVYRQHLEGYGNLATITGLSSIKTVFAKYGLMDRYAKAERDPADLSELLAVASMRIDNVFKTSCWDTLREKYMDRIENTLRDLENIETVIQLFKDIYKTDVTTIIEELSKIKITMNDLYDKIRREPPSSYSCILTLASAPKLIEEAEKATEKLWNTTRTAYSILRRVWDMEKVYYVYSILAKQTRDPKHQSDLQEIRKLLDDATRNSFVNPGKSLEDLKIVEQYWEKIGGTT